MFSIKQESRTQPFNSTGAVLIGLWSLSCCAGDSRPRPAAKALPYRGRCLYNPMDMAMFAPAGDGMRGGVHMCNRPGATANCWFHTMLLSRLRRRMATATELTEVWRGHYCRKLCIDIHASMFVLALARARVQIWGLCICSCPGAPLKRNKRPVGTIFVQVYV